MTYLKCWSCHQQWGVGYGAADDKYEICPRCGKRQHPEPKKEESA